ncbi:MAG: methyltransferase domain-containing protein [Butyrivibrio sp.]|nr:methyltransferase domain-containing protein [Muribaculum sp.]MCM1551926.1 methyltransferase domain-containing protein [Butyrivibrio sp.]
MKWNAEEYTKNFSFVHKYGSDVLELLDLEKGMSVLDLGCGNGALTIQIAETGARAVGLDDSRDLLQVARKAFPQLEFIQADAADFHLEEQFDVVFSNAVLHWIKREKQPRVLQCVREALKPSGQFVFEFGGLGNNQRIHAALERVFAERGLEYKMPFYFPSIGEYATLLEQAGFRVTYMTLFDRLTRLNGENGLADWIHMFVQNPFKGVDYADKEDIIKQAVDLLREDLLRDGVWYADYVRIRGSAVLQ